MIEIKLKGFAEGMERVEEITKHYRKLDEKANEIARQLAEIGMKEAKVRFANAVYNEVDYAPINVYMQPTKDGYEIIAEGKEVCFIEFGAGVTKNGSEPYPMPRPSGIAKIGQFGQGKGRRKAWFYYDNPIGATKDGAKPVAIMTRGTKAQMPMYHAYRKMEDSILDIVKKVLEE